MLCVITTKRLLQSVEGPNDEGRKFKQAHKVDGHQHQKVHNVDGPDKCRKIKVHKVDGPHGGSRL